MKILKSHVLYILPLILCPVTVVAGESGLSFSVKALGGGWSGKNKTSGTEFESTEGGQLGFAGMYQNGGFYTGLNLQGGEYTFEKNTPDQVTTTGRTEVSNDKISRNEFDLIFGYYLTRHISIFLDIKAVTNKWESNQYEQKYNGLGLGVNANWPVNMDWTIYGTVGRINSGEISHNEEKIGEGSSSGVEIGAMYQLSKQHRLVFGLKRSNYNYKFDSGDEQTHSVGGLFVGYNYAFSLD